MSQDSVFAAYCLGVRLFETPRRDHIFLVCNQHIFLERGRTAKLEAVEEADKLPDQEAAA